MNNDYLDKSVKRLVHSNRYEKRYACAVDILMQLNYLSKKDYEDWRFGSIDYLEEVRQINLSKLTWINNLIIKYTTELILKSSRTVYNQFGKGVKRKLRFSKSGDKTIEDRYAIHYIDKNRIIELKEK